MNFLLQLAQQLGLTGYESLSEEALQSKVTEKLQEIVSARTTAETSLQQANTQVENLNAQVTQLQEAAKGAPNVTELTQFRDGFITKLRDEVIGLYNKLMGDKAIEQVLTSLKESNDIKSLEAFKIQYQAQLEEKYPMSCKKCGSTEVNRASVQNSEENQGRSSEKSLQELREELHAKKTKTGGIPWAHNQKETK